LETLGRSDQFAPVPGSGQDAASSALFRIDRN
jgi:hypothetical protein